MLARFYGYSLAGRNGVARIKAQPEGLSAAGGEQAALAGRLLELSSRLVAAGAAGAGAAGAGA